MSIAPHDKTEALLRELAECFDDLTILARVEYASNLVGVRAGDPGEENFDSTLWLASKLLDGVIKVLRTVPRAANLRTPEA